VVPATATATERAPAPVRLSYPRIHAEMPVVPTGVADDGQMEIPEDAGTAGWYRFGQAPADARGTTVIAAHAGSEQTPTGPLYALRGARTGDRVEVRDAAGTQRAYRVAAVEQRGKDGLDLTPYFTRDGAPRLVLVTCGGRWIAERGSYADNIIVVAEPLG
jgi:sortase (surface protein transpeptidase)